MVPQVDQFFWFLSVAVGSGIMLLAPFAIAGSRKSLIHKAVTERISKGLFGGPRAEANDLQKIVDTEQEIMGAFRSIGITVVLKHASNVDARAELAALLRSLEEDLVQLRRSVALFHRAKATFEDAKDVIIRTRSSTLIEELDTIEQNLSSELAADPIEKLPLAGS